jgi:hypothetical protein
MANTIGQLVVRLGLDAAEFTSGLTKSEYEAKKLARSIDKAIGQAASIATTAIIGIGAAAATAFYAADRLIKQAGDFQDLAEKTGASAEAMASLSVAAKIGGTDMAAVAETSIKLTKNLSKINDESKGAGAALKAIGIPLKEFKQLDPAAQMERLAKALAGFEDGPGKTAVMEALVRGGAQLLPFLKELGEGVGRVNILTKEQITLADEYSDKQARAKALLNAYAQAMATQAAPAMTVFTEAMTEVIKELLKVDEASGDLKGSSAVKEFAESAARSLAVLGDGAFAVAQSVILIGKSYGIAAAIVGAVSRGEFQAAIDLAKEARAEGAKMKFSLGLQDKVEAGFSRLAQTGAGGALPPKKPKVDTSGLADGGAGAAGSAGAALRKTLDGQLKIIREFAEQQKDAYEFANQLAKGRYQDGLTSLADLHAKQKELRAAALQAELNAIDEQSAAWAKARKNPLLKEPERIDLDNKIAESAQKRAGIVEDAANREKLTLLENERAVKANAYAYYDLLAAMKGMAGDTAGASALRIAKQTQEAQELLTRIGFDPTAAEEQAKAYGKSLTQTDALSRAQNDYGRLVEEAGIKERNALLDAQAAGASEIDTLRQIGAVRTDALGAMGEMVVKARELAAALGTPEAALFAEKMALQFRQAAAEAEPLLQKVRDIGREMGQGIASSVEEALLARGKTLRERVLGMFTGISDQIQRILVKNLITKPLEDYLTKIIGGNGQSSGGGGLLGNLFGLGKKNPLGESAGVPDVAGPGDAGWGMDLGRDATGIAAQAAQTATLTASIAAQNVAYTTGAAAMTTLTASITGQNVAYATGTTAMAALTAAANAAAAALSAVAASGGGGGGAGGLGSLFGMGGGGGTFTSTTGLEGMSPETLALFGMATGGTAMPGSIHPVNEYGPELLDVRGKQFLMMGNKRGKVTPLGKGGGAGDTYIVQVNATPGVSSQQALNQGREIRRGIQLQAVRRGRDS